MRQFYKLKTNIDLKEIGKFPKGAEGGRVGNILVGHDGQYGPVKITNPIVPIQPIHKKTKLTDYFDGGSIKIIISTGFYQFLKPFLNKYQVWDMYLSNDVYKFDRKNLQYVLKDNVEQEFNDYKILHISYPTAEFINYKKSIFYKFLKLNEFLNYDLDLTLNAAERYTYDQISKKNGEKVKVNKKEILEENLIVKDESEYNNLFEVIDKLKYGKTYEEIKSLKIPNIAPKKITINTSIINQDMFRVFYKNSNDFSGYYVSEDLKDKILDKGFSGMTFTPLKEINPRIEIETI